MMLMTVSNSISVNAAYGRRELMLLPTDDIVAVRWVDGSQGGIGKTVGTERPHHHAAAMFVDDRVVDGILSLNQAIEAIRRGVLRDCRKFVVNVAAFFVVVQIDAD